MHFKLLAQPAQGFSVGFPVVLAFLLVAFAGVLPAADVDCPGESINDYLAGLVKTGPNTVSISGTCTESVNVDGFKDLTLNGPAVIQPVAGSYALRITGSEGVGINGLTFQGPCTTSAQPTGLPLVSVSRSSNVRFGGCTIEKSAGTGLQVDDSLAVEVWPGAIQDNCGTGMAVNGASTASVGFWGFGEWSDTYVQRNGAGLSIDRGAEVWVIHSATIQENRGSGVSLSRDSHMVGCCTGPEYTGPKFLNNEGWGIAASTGSVVQLWGKNLIEGNRGGGVSFNASQGEMWGGTVIQDNGDPDDDIPNAGIDVAMNSSATFDSIVVDNNDHGISVYMNSSVGICSPTISGNPRRGIEMSLSSTGHIWCPGTLTGNGGADVLCDTTSSLAGNKDAIIGKIKCPGYAEDPFTPRFLPPKKPVKSW